MKTIVSIAVNPAYYQGYDENVGLAVLAETVTIEGLELALHDSVEDDADYTVTDPVTGARLAQGKTPAHAVANAKVALAQAEAYYRMGSRPALLGRLREAFRFAH